MIVLDMNSAMAILSQFDHWAIKVENRGEKRQHSCTITHRGMRVTKYSQISVDAVKAAIHHMQRKIAETNGSDLRLVGS